MVELLTEHWLSLLFGLISAGALAYAKYISTRFKYFKELADEDEEEKLDKKIKDSLQPLNDKVELNLQRFESIKLYFRYLIIKESERFLTQGYMTSDEYQELSETFKVYHAVGGNSQAEEYYHKAIELPIKDIDKKKGED